MCYTQHNEDVKATGIACHYTPEHPLTYRFTSSNNVNLSEYISI